MVNKKEISKANDIALEEEIKEEKLWKSKHARKKTELETRIFDVADRLIKHYRKYVYPEWFNIIKAKEKFAWDMIAINYLKWHPNRSAMVYPLIEAAHDTYISNLYDSDTTSKAIPREEADIAKAEDAQDFFDWAYSVARADEEKELIRNEAALIGTSYGLSAVVQQEDYYKLDWDNVVIEDSDVYLPYAEHISALQMYVEPSTKNFYKARYKVIRKIMSLNEIEHKYDWWVDFDKMEDDIALRQLLMDSEDYISRHDFTKIYNIKAYQNSYIQSAIKYWQEHEENLLEGDFIDDNMFQVDYATDKLCEVIEYWEKEKLVIMVNGYVIYDGVNPYGLDPFWCVTYEKRPGTHFGVGIGQKLMSHQRQVNTAWNAVNDAINMHIRPMYTAVKWAVRDAQGMPLERIKYKDGHVVYTDNPNVSNWGIEPLQTIDYNIISLTIRHIQDLLAESQEIIGTNSYVQGGQGKVERSFGAVNARLGVTRSRLQPLIKSMNRFDEKMFHVWLVTSSMLMKDWVVVRILGEDDIEGWKTIKTKDLLNKFDVVVENEAVRQATKLERAQVMIQSLQTILPNLYDQVTGMPIADVKGIIKFAVEQNNFTGIDIFSPEVIEEFIKTQAGLQWMLASMQQNVQQQQQDLSWAGAWDLSAALNWPLEGIQSQLPTLDEVAEWESEAEITARGSFPQ